MTIWATTGYTESGDDLPVLLWSSEPTKKRVHEEYFKLMPDEYPEGLTGEMFIFPSAHKIETILDPKASA